MFYDDNLLLYGGLDEDLDDLIFYGYDLQGFFLFYDSDNNVIVFLIELV